MRARIFQAFWMLPAAFLFAAGLVAPTAAQAGEHGEKKHEKSDKADKHEKSDKADKNEHANSSGGTTISAGDTFYVKMTPMILPVIRDNGIQEVVALSVALEIKNQRTLESVNGYLPKLNDAYMRALYGKIDGSYYRNGRFLDVNKLKTKLVSVTNEVLGADKVNNVLIQGVNQRHFD